MNKKKKVKLYLIQEKKNNEKNNNENNKQDLKNVMKRNTAFIKMYLILY